MEQVEQGAALPTGNERSDATSQLDAAVEAELANLQRQGATDGPEPTDDDEQQPDDDADELDADPNDDADNDPDAPASAGEIEIGGKAYKVAPEVAEAFREGAMLKADHTRKTQEVAEYTRFLGEREQQLNTVFQAGEQFVSAKAELQRIDGLLGATYTHLQQNPSLQQTDPVTFGNLGTQLQMLTFRRQQVESGLNSAVQQHEQYTQQQRAVRLNAVRPQLQSMGIDNAELGRIAVHGAKSGLSEMALRFLDDGNEPAALLLIRDAMKYRELQGKTKAVQTQARQANAVRRVAPGHATTGNRTVSTDQLGKRLRGSGTVNDAVALELAYMGGGRRKG